MLKAIRNVIFVLSAFFSWGIVGSIELERLTLSEGMGYIGFAFAVCVILLFAEYAFRAGKVILMVYYLRRKKASHMEIRRPDYKIRRLSA